MRIPEGLLSPALIVIGWIVAIILLFIISRDVKIDNRELSQLAGLGGFIFVIQLIPIPLQLIIPLPFPIPLTLSGIAVIVMLVGSKKGVLVGSGAMILNHIFVPGAFSVLGLNLSNMILVNFTVGLLSYNLYRKAPNRRIRYTVAMIVGFGVTFIEGILILFELSVFHSTSSNLKLLGLVFLLYMFILGLFEGLFTAITSSYYYSIYLEKHEDILNFEDYDVDDEPESIEFMEDGE